MSHELDVHLVKSYGLGGKITTLAYDPLQRIWGIGCDQGDVWIFGNQGVERRMVPSARYSIRLLELEANQGKIMGVDKGNRVYRWDVETGKLEVCLELKYRIQCIERIVSSNVFWMGLDEGTVVAVKSDLLEMTGYVIPCLLEEDKIPVGDMRRSVISIQTQPLDYGQVLIGYPGNALGLWSIRQEKFIKRFQRKDEEKVLLTCLDWNVYGQWIVSGYSDGKFAFWDVKEDRQPISIQSISRLHGQDVLLNGIVKVIWGTLKDKPNKDSLLIILGGNPANEALGISLIHYYDNEFSMPKGAQYINRNIINILATSINPFYNRHYAMDALIILEETGSLQIRDLNHPAYPLTWIPSGCILRQSPMVDMRTFNLTKKAFESFSHHCEVYQKIQLHSIAGGFLESLPGFTKQDSHIFLIIATMHQNNTILFWNITNECLAIMAEFDIQQMRYTAGAAENADIVNIELRLDGNVFVVTLSDGMVLYFRGYGKIMEQASLTDISSSYVEHRAKSMDEVFVQAYKSSNNGGFELANSHTLHANLVDSVDFCAKYNFVASGDIDGFLYIVNLEERVIIYSESPENFDDNDDDDVYAREVIKDTETTVLPIINEHDSKKVYSKVKGISKLRFWEHEKTLYLFAGYDDGTVAILKIIKDGKTFRISRELSWKAADESILDCFPIYLSENEGEERKSTVLQPTIVVAAERTLALYDFMSPQEKNACFSDELLIMSSTFFSIGKNLLLTINDKCVFDMYSLPHLTLAYSVDLAHEIGISSIKKACLLGELDLLLLITEYEFCRIHLSTVNDGLNPQGKLYQASVIYPSPPEVKGLAKLFKSHLSLSDRDAYLTYQLKDRRRSVPTSITAIFKSSSSPVAVPTFQEKLTEQNRLELLSNTNARVNSRSLSSEHPAHPSVLSHANTTHQDQPILTTPQIRSVEEIKRKYGFSTVKDEISHSGQLLQHRGEKLESLQSNVHQLSANAANLSATVRDYNHQQANKKWYEI